MSTFKMPYLEPYSGRDSRHTCPGCKHEKTFKYYIRSETGRPIHKTVGRCDRELKCGYHYTPREYFRDNPEIKSFANKRINTQTAVCGNLFENPQLPNNGVIANQSENINYYEIIKKKYDLIPMKYVINSISNNSHFVQFLRSCFQEKDVMNAITSYALGTTRNRRVIYWQIDINDNVRTGKIMQYNPMTGKRVKNEKGGISWTHNIIKKKNSVYNSYKLSQCYFGEHLLKLYPEKPVAMVEAEKTAVIGSIHCPDFIWLAAGNLNGLTVPKSRVLQDRHVMLFPDAGCYDKWSDKMNRISREVHCTMEVSDVVEKHATEQQIVNGYDFADYIIEKLNFVTPQLANTETSLQINETKLTETILPDETSIKDKRQPSEALQKMIDKNPSLTTLISKLGLEEMG